MKILKSSLFFRFFCALVLASVFFGARSAVAHKVTTDDTAAEDVVDAPADRKQDVLREFVEHAAVHFEGAQSFEQAAQLFNGFRNEKSWNYGGIYIVLLTARGGVYVHPNRELEDQDWSALLDEKENNVGGQFLNAADRGGDFVMYYGQGDQSSRVSYALPVVNPSVPLSNPSAPDRQKFILLGGFDQEHGFPPPSYDPDQNIKLHSRDDFDTNPSIDAEEVMDKARLKQFVGDAIRVFLRALDTGQIDVIQLRRVFRLDDGPWRHVATYIYIMDERGNVIFNGANRDIEQTNLWDFTPPDSSDTFIQRIIAAAEMPGGGFIDYNWDDPGITGDEPPGGGAGGTSPKVGFAEAASLDPHDHLSPVYVFGSGLYLGSQDDDGDGACAIAGAGNTLEGTVFNLFLLVSALFLAVSSKRHLTGRRKAQRQNL
jgi:hypothetical protein